MKFSILHLKNQNPKLELSAENGRELFLLKSIYRLLNEEQMACGEKKTDFTYEIVIDLIKDE